jgi:hypothetical protein
MQIDDLQNTVKSLKESTKTADGRWQRSAPSADERKEGKKIEERKSDRLANKGKGGFR